MNAQWLIDAACSGNVVSISALLETMDPAAEDSEALLTALAYGHLDVAKLLVDAGADINARNREALRIAITNNEPKIVDFIVGNGGTVTAEIVKLAQRARSDYIRGIVMSAYGLAKAETMARKMLNAMTVPTGPPRERRRTETPDF